MDPFRALLCRVPPGDKTFAGFQKGKKPHVNPIVFTYVLFWVRKRIVDFKFTGGFFPFWDLENVLSPGGTLRSKARKGSNCFYFRFNWCRKKYQGFQFTSGFFLFESLKMFYPPEGLCGAEAERGPIVLLSVRKRILDFQFTNGFFSLFETLLWRTGRTGIKIILQCSPYFVGI